MRSIARVALLVVALATVPVVGVATAAAASQAFRTPSGNINCLWLSAPTSYLRCDITSGLKPMPRRPASCDFDWGHGLFMTRRSIVRVVCASDAAIVPGSPVLRYGYQWSRGGFTCVSRKAALTCTNAADHGFRLSKQSWERF